MYDFLSQRLATDFGKAMLIIMAVLSSLILALRRVLLDPREPDNQASARSPWGRRLVRLSNFHYSFLFNFVGSLAGWFLLEVLFVRARSNASLSGLYWADLIPFLFAFIGISGHLPQTAYGLVLSVGRLVDVAADKVGAKGKAKSPEG